ncbi:hypothetical protein ACIQF6_02040 [Kitasatospora sp. NPDC092948]|uniref:hypothetical protein n=1 Tax=Kitasatospora sp. NPDC092948 TaxID=3364088 RepID=UPI003813ECAB
MADETVWLDLDEVETAAKKIMSLLAELEGPANHLEAVVKQVEGSVYGTDLVGKALKGGGSAVGGLDKHQQQVLEGIRELMKNATAVGQNLQTMAARHRANDELQGGEIGKISTHGDMPAAPRVPGGPVEVTAPLSSENRVPAADPVTPPPPTPVASIGNTNTDDGYQSVEAPKLDYNHHKDIPDPIRGGGGPGMRQVI